MRIGISDSPLARSLLNDGSLVIDFLEVHGPHAASARAQFPDLPMLLHNPVYNWSLCDETGITTLQVPQVIQQGLILTCSPWYSVHLGFSAVRISMDESARAISEVLPPDVLFDAFCTTICALQSQVETPLLLENLDYVPGGAYEHICEPGFITSVLESTHTSLLVDLAHARISAAALALRLEDYLLQFPLEHVRQIHVNRPTQKDGWLYDAHEAMEEEDHALLAWLLERCRPEALTLEYNLDRACLLAQITRLRREYR